MKTTEARKAYHKAWRARNKEHLRQQRHEYYLNNKEKLLKKNRKWAEDNKERVVELNRAMYLRDGEKKRAQARKWARDNRGKRRSYQAKRKAHIKQRTPTWANLEKIAEFYEDAKTLEDIFGLPFHVDHIIPLQGVRVSGLHHEDNLQILPAALNLRKSNSY